MDKVLRHLGRIVRKEMSVREPVPGLITLNLLHLRRSEQE